MLLSMSLLCLDIVHLLDFCKGNLRWLRVAHNVMLLRVVLQRAAHSLLVNLCFLDYLDPCIQHPWRVQCRTLKGLDEFILESELALRDVLPQPNLEGIQVEVASMLSEELDDSVTTATNVLPQLQPIIFWNL